MVRRALAAAVLGISLWLGSLAWSGFVLLRTVLDPERSRDVAEALYEDETVRAQLADNIAGGIASAVPPGVPVPRDGIDATATAALDSPAVEAVFVDALARTHAAFLGEGEPPRSVDAGAFGAAARDVVVERSPELDALLPASPELAIALPTEQVPNLGPVRDALAAAVPVLAVAAGAGTLLALVVTSHRPAVVRRAGVWAIGLSATALVLAYGVPYVAEAVLPGQAAVISALVRAMAEATRVPALALAGTGVGAVVVAALWRQSPATAPAPAPREGRPAPPVGPPRRDLPHPPRRPAPAVPRPRFARGDAPGARAVEPAPPPRTWMAPSPAPTPVDGAAPERTRWVEGIGWVLEPSAPIPPHARWVPGVGYVVDER